MRHIIAKTKSGIEIPIRAEYFNDAIISFAVFEGKEYKCELRHEKGKPCVVFSSASRFQAEICPQLKGQQVAILLTEDYEPYLEEVKAAQIAAWTAEAQSMKLETLRLRYHSHNRWSIVSPSLDRNIIKYHPILSNLNLLDSKKFQPALSDYDDYNAWSEYEIAYTELETAINEALKAKAIDDEKSAAEERAEKERVERMYANVEKVEKSKVKTVPGLEEEEYCQDIKVTMRSGNAYRFKARNIFDFGYILNPMPGGGIVIRSGGKYVCDSTDGQREMSDEEMEAFRVATYETRGMKGIRM